MTATVERPDAFQRAEKALSDLSIDRALAAEETRIEEGVERIPTGFPRLDAATGGGLEIPSFNVLAAAPKSGKSTLTDIIAIRNAEAGGVSYVLDSENGCRRFLRRALCRRAGLGPSVVAAALRDQRAGVFASRDAVERWREAKEWLRGLRDRLFVDFRAPDDFVGRVAAARAIAGDRKLLVAVDSVQKLPMDFADRRASVDQWLRIFEAVRDQLDVALWVVSEIKRDFKGGYTAHESAFKESGGIEYAADLAMTLTRPRADEDDAPRVSTLRIELARDCEEAPEGDVASYTMIRPHYGMEEGDPAPRRAAKGTRVDAGCDFLREILATGPVRVSEILAQGAKAGLSRPTLYRARASLRLVERTVDLKSAWGLP